MSQEIERKYLVKDNTYVELAITSEEITQGYLCRDIDRTVRVRVRGSNGYLTIKSRNHGATRGEWEYPIPITDARDLLKLCGDSIITKRRYIVPYEGHIWEVDIFGGRHLGLKVAEIELGNETESFILPPFAGKEVTGDAQYYNSELSKL